MKRWRMLFLLLALSLLLTACGGSAPESAAALPTAVPQPETKAEAEPPTPAPTLAPTPAPAPTDAPAASKIDIDLAHMSSTMQQAQITEITENHPEQYVGQTVLVSGRYYNQISKRLNLEHHYVLVGDELSCCAQLVEFQLTDGVYPDSYPELDAPLTVQGVYAVRDTDYGQFYVIQTDHI